MGPARHLALLALVLATPVGRAASAPYDLVDLDGAHDGRTPVALLVVTPGVGLRAYDPLARALEGRGLDAWAVAFPVAAQDPRRIVAEWLPDAMAHFDGQSVVLVGHGLGGTLAAEAVAAATVRPDALALLGAPLRFLPQALTTWLAEQPIPPLGLDLAEATQVTWRDRPVLGLLLGEPLPPLEPVSAAWLEDLARRVEREETVSLAGVSVPLWIGMATLDNVAPPESVRGGAPGITIERFGYNRLDPQEYRHIDLLVAARPIRACADWASHQHK